MIWKFDNLKMKTENYLRSGVKIRVVRNIFFRFFIIFIFSHSCVNAFSQHAGGLHGKMLTALSPDSFGIRISLLTCSPGEELYSTFGHSAFRVIDNSNATDRVYNYGTFDFDDPDFYTKFARGKLKYFVSVSDFNDFKQEYILTNRSIKEQVLNFSTEEKQAIIRALAENIKEENKFYMYDFFLDNCTTRLRDIMVKYHQPVLNLPAVMPANYTFRNAIHQYLDANNKQWSKLGIDILLGAPTDAVMTTAQQQFLPDNLMLSLDKARTSAPVSPITDLYEITPVKNEKPFFTPLVLFSCILAFFVLLSLSKNKALRRILYALDGLLFFAVGALGIILVLMWVATDHSMTKNNYNILWAWPMHIVYAFFMNRNTPRVRTYSKITAIFLLLLLCCWHFLAQEMNNALIPLVLLLIYRSAVRGFFERR